MVVSTHTGALAGQGSPWLRTCLPLRAGTCAHGVPCVGPSRRTCVCLCTRASPHLYLDIGMC